MWVEVYAYNMYAIKFHLKAHRNSSHKYSILTGLNEARPVVNTCIAIMLEIARTNPQSSFGFIGANIIGESDANTKRYRFYKRMMATYFSKAEFRHFSDAERSTYMLIRRSELDKTPDLLAYIEDGFKATYAYFD